MDGLDENEIEGIWKRTKSKISTENLYAKSTNELSENIRDEIKRIRSGKYTGIIDTLLDKNFNARVAELPSVQEEFLELPSIIKKRKGKKYAIKTKSRGTRIFSSKSIRITESYYRGKRAFFIYNTKLKRTVSWVVE